MYFSFIQRHLVCFKRRWNNPTKAYNRNGTFKKAFPVLCYSMAKHENYKTFEIFQRFCFNTKCYQPGEIIAS